MATEAVNYQSLLKEALLKVQQLKARLDEAENKRHEPLAIVGMACRYPGANTPEEFWTLLHNGVDMMREIPATRWDSNAYYDATPAQAGKTYVRHGAFLEQVDQFDPVFFNISPREAVRMDPQHRLLLETSWEALERAALVPAQLHNSRTGVFVAMNSGDYAQLLADNNDQDVYATTGNGYCFASGRLSYVLGLQGPNLVVDTACSASLVALHLAGQSLRAKECDLALVGAVQLMLTPEGIIAYSQMQALAADGRCKTFDAAADGFNRGEGCGVLVLKRLADALAAADPILAVVRGSAVNHGGASGGLTVPSKAGQEKLIRAALNDAQVAPHEVLYVEAHGTGTSLGDPIEAHALADVFHHKDRSYPLWIGSVKTNIGHLEAAAGLAGLMKTILAFQHDEIPPHLHFQQPNPHIDWANTLLRVPIEPTAWPQPNGTGEKAQARLPRLAGISSFGMGGTNAHVILAEAPSSRLEKGVEKGSERPYHLLTLSAKSLPALKALAQNYHIFLANPDLSAANLGDICYTANLGRSHFEHRLSVVADSVAQLCAGLADENTPSHQAITPAPSIAFLFTGQGSQYVGMGRELYATHPTFRATLDRCDEILRPLLGASILQVMYPESVVSSQSSTVDVGTTSDAGLLTLDSTCYTQPALFVLEYALATLWQAWGIQPTILIGHSIGELVAACVAGVFNLADALNLVAARGRLMGALPQDGAMVSCLADEQRVRQAIAPYANELAIAAVNGPASIVIAGKQAAMQAVVEELAGEGIKTRQLTVSHAFHSPLMEPMLDDFYQVAASVTYHKPTLPLVSNLTGKLAGEEIQTPAYWLRHVRETVRFADGIATLHEYGINSFLEIGPGATLLGLAEQTLDKMTGRQDDKMNGAHPVTLSPCHLVMLPSLRKNQPDWQQMLNSLGELYMRGAAIDWQAFDQPYPRRKVVLPTYPFQRQRYWLDMDDGSAAQRDRFSWLTDGKMAQLTERVVQRMAAADTPVNHTLVEKLLMSLRTEQDAQQVRDKVAALFYTLDWVEQSLERIPATVPAQPGRWVILADRQGVGQALATQVAAQGQQVETFTADSLLDEVLSSLTKQTTAPASAPLAGVVHLWGLDYNKLDETTFDLSVLARFEQTISESLLRIVQTLAASPGSDSERSGNAPAIWVATHGAQIVQKVGLLDAKSSPFAVLQTPLWGLGRTVEQEHTQLWGGLIDLDSATTEPSQAANALLQEILSSSLVRETQVAYCQGRRFVARLVKASQPVSAELPTALPIDAHGIYLVTGGLGGIGLTIAEWLAQHGATQLILTARRGITTAAQQAAVVALQNIGVTVEVAPVDVADEPAMGQLLTRTKPAASPVYSKRG